MKVKWEPAALMLLVLGLGFWLALGPASRPKFPVREGSTQVQIRVADTRGVLEAWRPSAESGPEETEFRVFMKGGRGDVGSDGGEVEPSRVYSSEEIREMFGERVLEAAVALRGNRLFTMLNITSWVGVVWVGIGLLGQLAFSGRMLLQWFISERRRESIITESFWWFSLFGALMLFSYFVWRQDPVGILGQASGIVIYARNIRLIFKKKRRAREEQRRLEAIASIAVAESLGENTLAPAVASAEPDSASARGQGPAAVVAVGRSADPVGPRAVH
ncbi:MAG: lipid-A-disaccharide synthase N-terminal domain-containing protein [Phycisphaeraceae bacterium]|nr:lipid-A-disaccharide synthase N-terminal domain-containing protein [Phycisphaeraceae bacterium]